MPDRTEPQPAGTDTADAVSDFDYETAFDTIARAVKPAGRVEDLTLDEICRAVRALAGQRDAALAALRYTTAATVSGDLHASDRLARDTLATYAHPGRADDRAAAVAALLAGDDGG